MTLTLEIDAETAAALTAEAARRHAPLETVAADALRAFRAAVPTEDDLHQAALARIHSGFYAACLSSSDAFANRKAEEQAQEERRWRQ